MASAEGPEHLSLQRVNELDIGGEKISNPSPKISAKRRSDQV